jgi:hypothetical protein
MVWFVLFFWLFFIFLARGSCCELGIGWLSASCHRAVSQLSQGCQPAVTRPTLVCIPLVV